MPKVDKEVYLVDANRRSEWQHHPVGVSVFGMNDNEKPIVIYVPGLYASTLSRKRSGGNTWFSRFFSDLFSSSEWDLPWTLLISLFKGNRGHLNLSLPITWSKDTDTGYQKQDKDDIYASDILYFTQGKMMDFLRDLDKNGLIELHTIPWDWRRGLEEAEQKVSKELERICKSKYIDTKDGVGGVRRIILASHSTGTALCWPTVNAHPELFDSWVSIAGCTTGSNMLFGNLRDGWNKSFIQLLGKEALFTFPTIVSYNRLPNEEFCGLGDSDFVAYGDGSDVDVDKITDDYDCNGVSTDHPHVFLPMDVIDTYKLNDWKRFKLGIYGWKSEQGKDVTDAERIHLENSLASAKRFREAHFARDGKCRSDDAFLQKNRKEYDHIDLVCYGSDSFQTHSAYMVTLGDKDESGQFTGTVDVSKSFLTTSGDGTLWTADWITLPGNLNVDVVYAESGSAHVAMVNDDKLLNLLATKCFPQSHVHDRAMQLVQKDRQKRSRSKKKKKHFYIASGIVLASIAAGICIRDANTSRRF